MSALYLAREPVYDHNINIYGYELVFRSNNGLFDNEPQSDMASMSVLDTIEETHIDRILGHYKTFINLDDCVHDDTDTHFNPGMTILEVDSHHLLDSSIIARLHSYAENGYMIAVNNPDMDSIGNELVGFADIVRLNTEQYSNDDFKSIMARLKPHGVKLLASEVDSPDSVENLLNSGFDYIQGHFLSRPSVGAEKKLSPNRLAVLQLMSRVFDPDTDTSVLEEIIRSDVSLSYNLLRYINSAFFNLQADIESIRHAVVFLGRNAIRTWASVIAMASHNDKPVELMKIALIRARMCELLATSTGHNNEDSFFTTGLFSTLDALLDQPISVVLEDLPLIEDIHVALTQFDGLMGKALVCARGFEECSSQQMNFDDIPASELNQHYVSAIEWAEDAMSNMQL